MYRVTTAWKIIDIDTYDDVNHMKNILYRYDRPNSTHTYYIDYLRAAVNRFIENKILEMPKNILAPITYSGEWLEIIKKHHGRWYEGKIDTLKKTFCSHWKYDWSTMCATTHISHDWYTMVNPREFLMRIINSPADKYKDQLDSLIEETESLIWTWYSKHLPLSQQLKMTTPSQTINEAYFADKEIITKASRAVEILQASSKNLNNLGKFVWKFSTKINSIQNDINNSFDMKDKDRFIEATDKVIKLFEFLHEDNLWSDIIDIAEEFADEEIEFDAEEYLSN